MGTGANRQRTDWIGRIEQLEDRVYMSADPVGGFLGGAISHHALLDQPPILEHHQVQSIEQHQDIAIDHHVDQTPDFWIDPDDAANFDEFTRGIDAALASAHDQSGLTTVRNNYGFLGRGQTVAVIDSGIAYDHFALGGGLGQNYRVVGGWDFTGENDADPYDDGPGGSHGTHVSGIIGADSGTNTGVAPGVDLVGLRVFDDAGAGFFSWVGDALDWVHNNRNNFENPITAVNLSLGISGWNAETAPTWASFLETKFAQLEADGIFIAVSAGNSFTSYNTPGLSYPAASQYVVPVMSADDSGLLSYYSQRNSRAIAAPGRGIVSTVPDYNGNNNGITDDYGNKSGTSMASPYIAGASVIVREAMEFVGMTNITQDTIYDHMIATADSFFDSATNAWYDRLNMQSAIDALMPTDDYGSTIGSAYDMGIVGSATSMNGVISTLSDADYFSFTSGITGTVSFTSAATHDLASSWDGGGNGSVSGANGETYTFDVVAGQSYSLGLSTSDGLGYYDLAIAADSTFTFTDWGIVTQSQVNNLGNSADTWYRIEASRAGFLTAEASFSGAQGDIDLNLYDTNLQLVSPGAHSTDSERVDVYANLGDEFFLRVTGANADIDFQLTNLVTLNGSTVTITGTASDDTFTYTAGTTHTVAVNGTAYGFSAAQYSTINFDGGAGSDSITMTGTTGDETATLRVGDARFVGSGFTATAIGVENVSVHGGGGNDIAYLYDSVGDDLYRAWHDHNVMSGDGYYNYSRGFGNVFAYASAGNDRTINYDSSGDDLFRAWHDHSVFSGNGFFNYTSGFDDVQAYATQGNDRVVFYDSASDDLFRVWKSIALMTNDQFFNYASGFDQIEAYATLGNDRADLFGTAEDDLYRAWHDRVQMSGSGYFNYAKGFDSTYAYASGGNDRADLFDSSQDDLLRAWSTHAVLSGAGFYNYTRGFTSVYSYASEGYDRAILYDSVGDDTFQSWNDHALITGDSYYNYTQNFDDTQAYATTGNDQAFFFDSAGNDVYRAWHDRALMFGDGFFNYARGFDDSYAYSTAGNDRADLFDSIGNDTLTARSWGASLTGGSYYLEARNFGEVNAYSLNGGNDQTDIEATDYVFNMVGQWS